MVTLYTDSIKENIPNLNEIKQTVISKTSGDRIIWGIVLILSLISILVVYSSTGSLSYLKYKGNTNIYLKNQFIFICLGLGIIFFIHKLNYIIFSKFAKLFYIISIGLLIYTQFWGVKINEGSRWIRIPLLHITFQSSDFAKLFLYIYISKLLSQGQEILINFRQGYLKLITPVILICFLIALSNLSNACIIYISCLILFIIGRVKFKYVFFTILISLIPLILLISLAAMKHNNSDSNNFKIPFFSRFNTWVNRVESFIYQDENSDNYQVVQAKIAIANGSVIIGLGPGNSQQRNFLPQAYNDFIFAIIIEEYGLIGGVLLIFLYLAFLFRCIILIQRCKFSFGTFLIIALGFTLVIQALVNVSVCVNLLPVTGVTLPFISLGGSSFVFTCLAIGIILSVSRFNNEQNEKIVNTNQSLKDEQK